MFSCLLNADICRIIKTTFPLVFNVETLLVFILVFNSAC